MTDARQVIERQMNDSGSTLMAALELISDDEFYAVNPNGFPAVWVAGHLACVCDLFSSWFDGRILLGAAHQVFNSTAVRAAPVSRAVDREQYPKDILLLNFQQAMVKALRALAAFDIEQWDAEGPPGTPRSLGTGGRVWEALGVHCYWHSGELAGSMPRFHGTNALNPVRHYFYIPPELPDPVIFGSPGGLGAIR